MNLSKTATDFEHGKREASYKRRHNDSLGIKKCERLFGKILSRYGLIAERNIQTSEVAPNSNNKEGKRR